MDMDPKFTKPVMEMDYPPLRRPLIAKRNGQLVVIDNSKNSHVTFTVRGGIETDKGIKAQGESIGTLLRGEMTALRRYGQFKNYVLVHTPVPVAPAPVAPAEQETP